MEKPDVKLVAEATFHGSVDELDVGHGRSARDFGEIVETDSDNRAVCRLDKPGAVAFD